VYISNTYKRNSVLSGAALGKGVTITEYLLIIHFADLVGTYHICNRKGIHTRLTLTDVYVVNSGMLLPVLCTYIRCALERCKTYYFLFFLNIYNEQGTVGKVYVLGVIYLS